MEVKEGGVAYSEMRFGQGARVPLPTLNHMESSGGEGKGTFAYCESRGSHRPRQGSWLLQSLKAFIHPYSQGGKAMLPTLKHVVVKGAGHQCLGLNVALVLQMRRGRAVPACMGAPLKGSEKQATLLGHQHGSFCL